MVGMENNWDIMQTFNRKSTLTGGELEQCGMKKFEKLHHNNASNIA
jgi:hypothetical protein